MPRKGRGRLTLQTARRAYMTLRRNNTPNPISSLPTEYIIGGLEIVYPNYSYLHFPEETRPNTSRLTFGAIIVLWLLPPWVRMLIFFLDEGLFVTESMGTRIYKTRNFVFEKDGVLNIQHSRMVAITYPSHPWCDLWVRDQAILLATEEFGKIEDNPL
ncbi:hypothetical protein LAZ67_11001363 [Cordylochernes scorpioides]|uniref:Uncharacterized protein n=1 Tax=Cordylochernes scorpioides TaxID=51811 RepID=A0ABY6L161_9ARAC|nr:hypothetical protein LAZ67_11001363 [Cordylochernes scorpioides]